MHDNGTPLFPLLFTINKFISRFSFIYKIFSDLFKTKIAILSICGFRIFKIAQSNIFKHVRSTITSPTLQILIMN